MDGTLGSQTAWMLDGSGVQITSGERARRDRPARRRGGVAGGRARDRRPRESRGARRVRGDARALAAARAASADRACAAARHPRTCRASPSSASPARCSSPTHRPTATSPTSTGRGRPTARTHSGRCSSQEPWSQTAATRRSRSSTHSQGSAPGSCGRSTSGPHGMPSRRSSVEQAFHATCVAPAWLTGAERRRGKLMPGNYADLVVLDRDPWDDLDARGRCDDGRRPLGTQPSALGLRTARLRFCVRLTYARPGVGGVERWSVRSLLSH